jgi:phosphoglycerate dehydrogenase-like enzyme
VREGTWRQVVGRQLTGKTVGVIGCGHIGKEVVSLLRPFACRMLAFDIEEYTDFYREHDVEAVALATLLSSADVVTLHLPLDESTRGMLGRAEIESMKEGAVLINMARGGLVDEAALKQALLSGSLSGAAFDVFANEPPEDAELIAIPTFVATPHIGGSSAEAILAMGRAAIAGLDEAVLPREIPALRGSVK